MRNIIIGSRQSELAMIQANGVIDQLRQANIQNPIKIKEMTTKGDQNITVSLAKIGGNGVFTGDIEQALADREIDFAVHSMKDLPPTLSPAFTIAAMPVREDPRDAYLARDHVDLASLPSGAVIGTSSTRRAAQIRANRPDLETKWIRGTVGSRIEQLEAGDYDAIILAVAGLKRLGIAEGHITEYLPATTFVPAIGQGALAIECRTDDTELRKLLATINDEATVLAVETERKLLERIEGGEQAPIGAYAYVDQGEITLYSTVSNLAGDEVIREVTTGKDPSLVAQVAVDKLMSQGAGAIIVAVNEELNKS